jgi:hypothetical protein
VQGVPRLAPVVDPLEHDEQVDVAFLPTVSTRAGAEEEDLEWMELADERVDRLVHPGPRLGGRSHAAGYSARMRTRRLVA